MLIATAAVALGGQQAAAPQPNLTSVKAEFIPGDKVIFYDDFSDMDGDEPPPHWKVRGGASSCAWRPTSGSLPPPPKAP